MKKEKLYKISVKILIVRCFKVEEVHISHFEYDKTEVFPIHETTFPLVGKLK